MQKHLDAQTDAIRVTLIGMVLDLALGVGKIIGGIFTSSFALFADGVHSLTDAATKSTGSASTTGLQTPWFSYGIPYILLSILRPTLGPFSAIPQDPPASLTSKLLGFPMEFRTFCSWRGKVWRRATKT